MKFIDWLNKMLTSTGTVVSPESIVDGTLTVEPHMTNVFLLLGIWRLDESSRRLEILTIVLAVLTVVLLARTFFP